MAGCSAYLCKNKPEAGGYHVGHIDRYYESILIRETTLGPMGRLSLNAQETRHYMQRKGEKRGTAQYGPAKRLPERYGRG